MELACGPARHAVEAARQGLAAAALDASEAMCARARENAAAVAVKLDVARGAAQGDQCPVAPCARACDAPPPLSSGQAGSPSAPTESLPLRARARRAPGQGT